MCIRDSYNIEFNVKPRELVDDSMIALEADLRASLNRADRTCTELGNRIVMIGILPTVTAEDFAGDWMSNNARYHALNDAMLAARGEDVHLDIEGPTGERLEAVAYTQQDVYKGQPQHTTARGEVQAQ